MAALARTRAWRVLGAIFLGIICLFGRKPAEAVASPQPVAAQPTLPDPIIALVPVAAALPSKPDFALAARIASVSSINTKAGRKPYRAPAPRAALKPQPKPVRIAAKKPKTIAGPVVLERMRRTRAAA